MAMPTTSTLIPCARMDRSSLGSKAEVAAKAAEAVWLRTIFAFARLVMGSARTSRAHGVMIKSPSSGLRRRWATHTGRINANGGRAAL